MSTITLTGVSTTSETTLTTSEAQFTTVQLVQILAILIAVLAVILVMGLLTFYCCRRMKHRKFKLRRNQMPLSDVYDEALEVEREQVHRKVRQSITEIHEGSANRNQPKKHQVPDKAGDGIDRTVTDHNKAVFFAPFAHVYSVPDTDPCRQMQSSSETAYT